MWIPDAQGTKAKALRETEHQVCVCELGGGSAHLWRGRSCEVKGVEKTILHLKCYHLKQKYFF